MSEAAEPLPGQDELDRLRHQVQQFQEFLEGLPDAVVDIDIATWRVTAINHTTTIVTGFTAEDVANGLEAGRLAPPEVTAALRELSIATIREGMARGGGRYQRSDGYNAIQVRLLRRNGSEFHGELNASYILDTNGHPVGVRTIIRDVSDRIAEAEARQATIDELQMALQQVKTLKGLIPVCAWCRRIRDDHGYWQQLETFLADNSDADITHGICEACSARMDGSTPSGRA